MTAQRKPRGQMSPTPAAQRAIGGRYLRWSFRYATWQVQDPLARVWRNVRPELVASFTNAGFPSYVPDVNDPVSPNPQQEMFP